jgi:hypothetical protein
MEVKMAGLGSRRKGCGGGRIPTQSVGIRNMEKSKNYIKEAMYDMAVGHLLLKSFWANEAVFQMMMLAYNLF